MTARKAITPAMKLECLFARKAVVCAICKDPIETQAECEWDHFHALCLGGPDVADNLRPVHDYCHKLKSKADARAMAKIRHLTGANKQRPKTTWAKRPFPKSRGFEPRRSA